MTNTKYPNNFPAIFYHVAAAGYAVFSMQLEKHNSKHKGKKGKKVVVKKKELIIQEQNKKRLENDSKDDLQKIDFLYENIDFHKPFDPIQKLKTEKGTLHFKFKLLSDKRLNIKYKILLYFELKDIDDGILNQEHKDTLKKICYAYIKNIEMSQTIFNLLKDDSEVIMECEYNERFKKWQPLKQTKQRIHHINDLELI